MEKESYSPDMDPDLYSRRQEPLESARRFIVETLPELGWGKNNEEEVVFDVGCGTGATTMKKILPLFPQVKKVLAVDPLPSMIDLARKQNAHQQIEYSVADIEDWSTVEQWNNQITKLVSIYVFHWLKDQRKAFQNVFQLLKTSGEAAILFVLQSTFFDSVLAIQDNSKWRKFFKGVDDYVADSHHNKWNDLHYKKILQEMGFEIRYCEERVHADEFSSDKEMINFFASICVLMPYVPDDQKDEFKKDLLAELLSRNGRNENGLPFHRGNMLELVIKKKC